MHEDNALEAFSRLKKEVEKTYYQKTTPYSKSIHDWTGNQIRDFQAHLEAEINERISERWFYLHLKPKTNKKTPRIDMLNILCRYVGYKNWEAFQFEHGQTEEKETETKSQSNKLFWRIGVLGIIVLIGVSFFMAMNSNDQHLFRFSFYDNDTKKGIVDTLTEVILMVENESPKNIEMDQEGYYNVNSSHDFITFVVKSPYYKTDTIQRFFDGENKPESIGLRRDDYALMIQFFANSAVQDWEKRRNQLDQMIRDDAVIIQIAPDNIGMEMFNKTEFIDKLTTPLESLGAIEIVETVYEYNEIVHLRFVQQ